MIRLILFSRRELSVANPFSFSPRHEKKATFALYRCNNASASVPTYEKDSWVISPPVQIVLIPAAANEMAAREPLVTTNKFLNLCKNGIMA